MTRMQSPPHEFATTEPATGSRAPRGGFLHAGSPGCRAPLCETECSESPRPWRHRRLSLEWNEMHPSAPLLLRASIAGRWGPRQGGNGNAVKPAWQIRSCPRNCERRANGDRPLILMGSGRTPGLTRKPGDRRRNQPSRRWDGWRAYVRTPRLRAPPVTFFSIYLHRRLALRPELRPAR